VDQGTHYSLLDRCLLYRDLCEKQMLREHEYSDLISVR
jgi:hypothetical protein